MNDAACQLFGLEAEQSIGKRLDERVRGLDWDSLVHATGAVSRDMEIFYPANKFINFYIVPLLIERREKGKRNQLSHAEPVGHAMILRDITESRRSAEKTIESERFNALTLLAAGVAHEIGNPLNSLHIHLQLMERNVRKLKGAARRELQESIDIARAEISRLDSIVTQFLKAIRPSPPQLHPENVNAIVEEAVRFFAAEIEDRDIVVEQELHSDLPRLELDRDQMKQVFYNVIKNSFEAMKRRGILHIRTDRDATHVNDQLHRHWRRNVGGKPQPRLRALLYDQGIRHRPWAARSCAESCANMAARWRSKATKAKVSRSRFGCRISTNACACWKRETQMRHAESRRGT